MLGESLQGSGWCQWRLGRRCHGGVLEKALALGYGFLYLADEGVGAVSVGWVLVDVIAELWRCPGPPLTASV